MFLLKLHLNFSNRNNTGPSDAPKGQEGTWRLSSRCPLLHLGARGSAGGQRKEEEQGVMVLGLLAGRLGRDA